MSITIIRAYYKGTSVEGIIGNLGMINYAINLGNEQIKKMLQNKISIKQIKETLIEELDNMEEMLTIEQKTRQDNGTFIRFEQMRFPEYLSYLETASFNTMTGNEFLTRWWTNVASLLKLKAIENDDMNGWMVIP